MSFLYRPSARQSRIEIVLYEYQKARHSGHPKEYYKDFKVILITDGLAQYHKLAREQEGLINANC